MLKNSDLTDTMDNEGIKFLKFGILDKVDHFLQDLTKPTQEKM